MGLSPDDPRLNVRTARKAAIRRASKRARSGVQRLDREALGELAHVYETARADLEAAILAAREGSGETVRLAAMQALLGQVNQRIGALGAERNRLLDGSLARAARLGVEPFGTGPAVSAELTRLADDAVRLTRTFVAEDGLQLSDRLWRMDMHARRVVGEAIQAHIIQGHGASEAAAEFLARGAAVPPEVAAKIGMANGDRIARLAGAALMTGEGNPYDNARRVMRTEINRAHGEAYQAAAFEHDDVVGMRFLLSPAHPEPDICDMHARVNRYGLGPGVYPRDLNPWPAHPNTLSFLEPVFADEVSEEDRAGKEDRIAWLARQAPERQAQVLGGRAKQQVLRAGLLREGEIATPWRVLKKRVEKRGFEVTTVFRPAPPPPAPTRAPGQPVIITTPPAEFVPHKTKAAGQRALGQHLDRPAAHGYTVDPATGQPAKRFKGGGGRRGHTAAQIFNQAKVGSLPLDAINETHRWLLEADQVCKELGIPPLRGVHTGVSRGAAASMGDGVLALSTTHTARHFKAIPSRAEAVELYRGIAARTQAELDQTLKNAALPNVPESSQPVFERIVARLEKNLAEQQGHIKALQSGRPVEEVLFPASQWKPGSQAAPPFLSENYLSKPLEKYRNTLWHEFGHHIHQQLGVRTVPEYINPPLERPLYAL